MTQFTGLTVDFGLPISAILLIKTLTQTMSILFFDQLPNDAIHSEE